MRGRGDHGCIGSRDNRGIAVRIGVEGSERGGGRSHGLGISGTVLFDEFAVLGVHVDHADLKTLSKITTNIQHGAMTEGKRTHEPDKEGDAEGHADGRTNEDILRGGFERRQGGGACERLTSNHSGDGARAKLAWRDDDRGGVEDALVGCGRRAKGRRRDLAVIGGLLEDSQRVAALCRVTNILRINTNEISARSKRTRPESRARS